MGSPRASDPKMSDLIPSDPLVWLALGAGGFLLYRHLNPPAPKVPPTPKVDLVRGVGATLLPPATVAATALGIPADKLYSVEAPEGLWLLFGPGPWAGNRRAPGVPSTHRLDALRTAFPTASMQHIDGSLGVLLPN